MILILYRRILPAWYMTLEKPTLSSSMLRQCPVGNFYAIGVMILPKYSLISPGSSDLSTTEGLYLKMTNTVTAGYLTMVDLSLTMTTTIPTSHSLSTFLL
jgi:hypothetical protein